MVWTEQQPQPQMQMQMQQPRPQRYNSTSHMNSPTAPINYYRRTSNPNPMPYYKDPSFQADGQMVHPHQPRTSPLAPRSKDVVCVVDPYSRKLEVPRQYLHETHALNRVGIPSLCMLYLDGRCRAGALCHQAHVDITVIEYLRKEALSTPTCCLEHGDTHSSNVLALIGDRHIRLHGKIVEPSNFGGTLGLQRLIRENAGKEIELLPRYICRLHLANKCRYVEECNHIHVCREMKDALAPPSPSSEPTLTPLAGSISSVDFSTEAPSTPQSTAADPNPNRWTHAPYGWRVLPEYDYLPARDLEGLSTVYPSVLRLS